MKMRFICWYKFR